MSSSAALCLAASRADGTVLYQKHCSSCHPDASKLLPARDLLQRLRTPFPGMPAFNEEKLSNDEIRAIGQHIRSAGGNAARPEAVPLEPRSEMRGPQITDAGTGRTPKAEKYAKTAGPWNRVFAGKWTIRGRQSDDVVTMRQFAINPGGNGEPEIAVSNVPSDYAVKVTAFELTERTLKLELTWSWELNPNYWKTEDFELRLSNDGRRLTGVYALHTSGGQRTDSNVWGE